MNGKIETMYHEDVSVSYTYYKGDTPFLFLFHGFGQTAEIFNSLIPDVCAVYSIIAFDLFAKVQDNRKAASSDFISIAEWNAIIEHICEKYSIENFSIVSFSMGTRFAVSMLKLQAPRIQRMVLIAPDGFGNTVWFRIATATYFTRKIFKGIMQYPAWIKHIAKGMYKTGLLNQITYRFIERNLENKLLTEKIYGTWVYVRKLDLSRRSFISLVSTYDIKVLFVLGKKDQLVASAVIRSIAAQTDAQLLELESAHHKLTQEINGSEVKRFLIPDRK